VSCVTQCSPLAGGIREHKDAHLLGHLDFDTRVVGVRVQHDNAVGEDVCHIRRFKGVRVAVHESLCEFLHQSINLLRLARQSEPVQELSVIQRATGFSFQGLAFRVWLSGFGYQGLAIRGPAIRGWLSGFSYQDFTPKPQ
jgi:hypothetical protein